MQVRLTAIRQNRRQMRRRRPLQAGPRHEYLFPVTNIGLAREALAAPHFRGSVEPARNGRKSAIRPIYAKCPTRGRSKHLPETCPRLSEMLLSSDGV